MQRTDFVRGVPDDVWAALEPILPPVVWQGNGRKPIDKRRCLHALRYILARGIGGEYLPGGFPGSKTVPRRLQRWLERDCFPAAWGQLAERYRRLHGINWDQLLLDGSQKPSKKGARRPAPVR
jgi:transposase